MNVKTKILVISCFIGYFLFLLFPLCLSVIAIGEGIGVYAIIVISVDVLLILPLLLFLIKKEGARILMGIYSFVLFVFFAITAVLNRVDLEPVDFYITYGPVLFLFPYIFYIMFIYKDSKNYFKNPGSCYNCDEIEYFMTESQININLKIRNENKNISNITLFKTLVILSGIFMLSFLTVIIVDRIVSASIGIELNVAEIGVLLIVIMGLLYTLYKIYQIGNRKLLITLAPSLIFIFLSLLLFDLMDQASNRIQNENIVQNNITDSAINIEGGEIGVVKWFDPSKGYGFIKREEGDDIFVNYKAIIGEGYTTLQEGDTVKFYIGQGPKGLQATYVRKIKNAKIFIH